ncbi:hypothetical protein [Emcibacter nanhaiensis]|uniref:EF-hand domain-containing protein n=1 Tax=Emcibacter nanhaiensis TaxID=1505037 RepID=A0A501PL97_9PROT|nr:hypothetical protein [Emcibacter nanhaiensis]TPD60621.1 hypothetical protein FIV46_07790 [Emcibacter nanhaiensis]
MIKRIMIVGLMAGVSPLTACADEETPAKGAKLDIRPYVEAIDANGDGYMSHAEWQKVGAPQSSFQMLDKDKDGNVTFEEMDSEAPPPGIDANKDGKLTLQEMLDFDKIMSEKMKNQAPPPPR